MFKDQFFQTGWPSNTCLSYYYIINITLYVCINVRCKTVPFCRTNWDANPIVQISSIEAIDSTIDYPAVTICNTFAYDRWGYLRNLLNLAKFLCDGDQDCQKTRKIREYLQEDPPFEEAAGLNTHHVWNLAKLTNTWLVNSPFFSDFRRKHYVPYLPTDLGKYI